MIDHTHSARADRPADKDVFDDVEGDAAPGEDAAGGDEDDLFDMANLSEARTGVPGFIFISTRVPQHGPRVKYHEKLGPEQPSFSVSIVEEPSVVANSLPRRAVNRMSPRVIEWVRLNRAALLAFWSEGVYWTKEQVDEHLDGLARLS